MIKKHKNSENKDAQVDLIDLSEPCSVNQPAATVHLLEIQLCPKFPALSATHLVALW